MNLSLEVSLKYIILAAFLIVGCGKHDPFPYNIAKGIGAEETADIDDAKKDLSDLEKRVTVLEQSLDSVINEMEENETALQLQLSELQSDLEQAIADGDSALQANINQQITNVNNARAAGDATLQSQLNGLLARLVAIESEERVVAIIDPCPSVNASFREVLIKTSSGKYFAYFESGSKRFLTVLSPGNYMTTDSRGCHFTI